MSGKRSALLLLACCALSAVLIPVASHLPHWIEFEIVLGAWWIVWWIVLTWMLFHGHEVEGDVDRPRGGRTQPDLGEAVMGLDAMGELGCLAGYAGCEGVALVLLAVPLLILGWFFVGELLVPGVGFVLLIAIRGMLARVTNPRRDCEDKPVQALFWGAYWATAYTAPVALIVWAVQAWATHRG